MLRHYAVDLLDWYRGGLSSRRLAVLVRQLPDDSALHRELHGEAARWTVTDYLLAHAVDRLAEANWMFAMVNRDEDAEPLEPPEPLPRPDADSTPAAEPDAAPRAPGPGDLATFFG
ncbi:hypothetical protein GPA10_03610 [Streptomyces sp. p1417]|uniref:Uncharacterized protein n=1 Tax=Streptomyces typhae TaxID=2681492 RepID=A0A6L6WNN8_9ACTN|nr:hypothetical protein [Streptomyces typhae]MVO83875.1 hypothetical protein [Streptomyces typhae]